MFGSRWLRNLLNETRSRKERRRLAARNRKPFRLMVEQLEDRITPVQTAGSYTELVNAIAVDTAPNTNYVIQITNNFTFSAGGQVAISKLDATSTLTIEGQNGTNFTLTGNGNRLFDVVGKTQNVTFLDLTLTGGGGTNVSQGGAIMDQGGSVTLSSVTVRNNSVTIPHGNLVLQPLEGGGGVFVSGDGSLSLSNAAPPAER
jgi:hypothetical protein